MYTLEGVSRVALVWFCLFPLPFGVCKGLRLMIVALAGLFSPFFANFITAYEVSLKTETPIF